MPLAHAAAVTNSYGIATPNGYSPTAQFAYCTVNTAPCPSGDLQGYYTLPASNGTVEQSAFSNLRADEPLTVARFFLPYNAIFDYSSSQHFNFSTGTNSSGAGCVFSAAYNSGVGEADWWNVIYDVQAAQADGLTPVIAFDNGVSGYGDPTIPDPSYGTSSSNPYAGWTNAGLDYECGVFGAMYWITGNRSGLGNNPVQDWEAWNEPDGSTQSNSYGGGYNGSLGACTASSCLGSSQNKNNPSGGYPNGPCGSAQYTLYDGATVPNACGGQVNPSGSQYLCGNSYRSDCGPMESTGLWILAQYDYQAYIGTSYAFQIGAMTLSHAQNTTWESAYMNNIDGFEDCGTGWYCNNGLADPSVYTVHDYDDPDSGVSTASTDISAFTRELQQYYGEGFTIWITESGDDLQNGTALDGSPTNQANGATAFLNLHNFGNTENITMTNWYEFQPKNPSSGWDSGVLAPEAPQPGVSCVATGTPYAPGVPYCVPSGATYSAPRQSLCVLAHASSVYCSSTAIDAEDWSTQQYN